MYAIILLIGHFTIDLILLLFVYY